MLEIKIPGFCSDECLFFGALGHEVFCRLGPTCPGPGTYRLEKVKQSEQDKKALVEVLEKVMDLGADTLAQDAVYKTLLWDVLPEARAVLDATGR